MDDGDILARIRDLIDEEHRLRERLRAGEVTSQEENTRIRRLETALDQCWDLLRRRRAARAAGQDPDEATVRPADQVERYSQ
ncbi:MAG: DUF2630 family protein [Actinomycetes bacterium]|jgi:hypothetical protein|nr:MAG: DUF2630 domain-containing protein [Actinomycetota bacterium]